MHQITWLSAFGLVACGNVNIEKGSEDDCPDAPDCDVSPDEDTATTGATDGSATDGGETAGSTTGDGDSGATAGDTDGEQNTGEDDAGEDNAGEEDTDTEEGGDEDGGADDVAEDEPSESETSGEGTEGAGTGSAGTGGAGTGGGGTGDPTGDIDDPGSWGFEPPVVEIDPAAHELVVAMTWETVGDDMDLHLLAPDGELGTATDCYFLTCGSAIGLDWGVVGETSDDPEFLIDESVGTGPEIINITAPPDGVYTVVVHDFRHGDSTDDPDPNPVAVEIYLGGTLAWTQTIEISGEDTYMAFAEIDLPAGTVTALGTEMDAPATDWFWDTGDFYWDTGGLHWGAE